MIMALNPASTPKGQRDEVSKILADAVETIELAKEMREAALGHCGKYRSDLLESVREDIKEAIRLLTLACEKDAEKGRR